MGLISNLVPTASTSCNAIDTAPTSQPLRKFSLAHSGNAIDTISSSIASNLPLRSRHKHIPILPPYRGSSSNSADKNSTTNDTNITNQLTFQSSHKNIYVDTEHEQKVNFQLPLGRRPSILHQPSLRERVKGSPRFPHRIAPTSSLNALVETVESAGNNNSFYNTNTNTKKHDTNSPHKYFFNNSLLLSTLTN